jgi:hypothetical protein
MSQADAVEAYHYVPSEPCDDEQSSDGTHPFVGRRSEGARGEHDPSHVNGARWIPAAPAEPSEREPLVDALRGRVTRR